MLEVLKPVSLEDLGDLYAEVYEARLRLLDLLEQPLVPDSRVLGQQLRQQGEELRELREFLGPRVMRLNEHERRLREMWG